MSISVEVAAHLPYLRRYARALTGSQAVGDGFVRATLEAAIADQDLAKTLKGGRVPLYAAFSKLWTSALADPTAVLPAQALHEAAAQARLRQITPLSRQALLLTTVEEFSTAEAAQVMGLAEAEVAQLVDEAIREIDGESATSVLIIEDEPLISMQLEGIVRSLGHEICGTASTRGQAERAVATSMPGLVLADIHLADGSSGLDAVDDILLIGSVPVIFITAFPERLLTGKRTEPTYLITKPFQESAVRAAISQALFFGSSQPLG